MIEASIWILVGVVCLYFGAEYLVHGSASFSLRMGLPPLVVGLVVVGYGTGVPELIVSVQASLLGKGDISVGNVIGSNLANIGLVLGFSALCRPLVVHKRVIEYDGIVLVIVSSIACIAFAYGSISRLTGLLFLLGLIIYTVWAVASSWKENHTEIFVVEDEVGKLNRSITIDVSMIGGGILLLIVGGSFFLDGAIHIAKLFDISDAIIGLTVVAIGTSLPEFATSIVAMLRKHSDLAVGNVIGSSIFNILAIIGVSASIQPITLQNIHWIDYGLMTGMAIAILFMMFRHERISRPEGAILLTTYLSYLTYLVYTL